MTVEQLTSFTIRDLSSVSIKCSRCGSATVIPLLSLSDLLGFGSGAPAGGPHPMSDALTWEGRCPCGHVLWSASPGEHDPVRAFVVMLLEARRSGGALSDVTLIAPAPASTDPVGARPAEKVSN